MESEHPRQPLKWFDDNPAKSVILYTITIMSVTWVTVRYLIDDRKELLHQTQLKLKQAQLDSADLIINQYASRVDFLQNENKDLQTTNQKYYEWLSDSPNSIQFFDAKIKRLENDIAKYRFDSQLVKDTTKSKIESKEYLISSGTMKVGEAFVDKLTGATIGINEIKIFNSAEAEIFLPPNTTWTSATVKAGTNYQFIHDGKKYFLIITKLDFPTQTYAVTIKQDN